jgi:type IV fimbrial biogenesis protein FimT
MTLAIGQNDFCQRAFTLIELILVLALLVIITSIAVPTMSRFIRGRALDSESERLMALTHVAQSRAVSEGMPVMLWINAA